MGRRLRSNHDVHKCMRSDDPAYKLADDDTYLRAFMTAPCLRVCMNLRSANQQACDGTPSVQAQVRTAVAYNVHVKGTITRAHEVDISLPAVYQRSRT
eukprot:6182885-Pleurochrysis_carterae.AAC.5